jgi:hypothetical protein
MRNVISGNWVGIQIEGAGATGNLVWGNFIGTDRNGTAAVGNGRGIVVTDIGTSNSHSLEIGGTAPHLGNVISGNSGDGIFLGKASWGMTIQGNLIGTDVTAKPRSATSDMARMCRPMSPTRLIIGGSTPAARNVISANKQNGIFVLDTVVGTQIYGITLGPTLREMRHWETPVQV